MKRKYFKHFFILTTVTAVVLSACIKNDVKELGTAGSTFLKLLESPTNQLFFSPFTDVRKIDLFSLRRDANSNAELNKPVTVRLRVDTAAIRAYNATSGMNFSLLPDSLYTIATTGLTKTGDLTYEMTLAPGEFAKEFTINLNGAKWDIANVYAMPIVIDDPGGLKVSSDRGQIISTISVKNKYDGVYRLRGYHNRDPYNFPYDQEMHMITSSPSSVSFYWPAAGSFGHPIGTGPDIESDVSWYGPAISPVVVFDTTTNVVSNVYNRASTVITRFDGATGSNVSRYIPGTNTIIVHWNYNNNPERAFFDTLTFVRSR